MQLLLQLCDAPQFVQKPFIDGCELMNLLHTDSIMQRLVGKSQHMLLKLSDENELISAAAIQITRRP